MIRTSIAAIVVAGSAAVAGCAAEPRSTGPLIVQLTVEDPSSSRAGWIAHLRISNSSTRTLCIPATNVEASNLRIVAADGTEAAGGSGGDEFGEAAVPMFVLGPAKLLRLVLSFDSAFALLPNTSYAVRLDTYAFDCGSLSRRNPEELGKVLDRLPLVSQPSAFRTGVDSKK